MCNKIRKSGILPILFGLMTTFFLACSEEDRLTYLNQNASAPAVIDIKTVQIENYAGMSVLRYQLPKDDYLMSVKAVYESAPGMVREVRVSRYTDSLLLVGFGQAGDYPVQLYSVGKNGKSSDAVTVTVSPKASPIYDAFESLNVKNVFGGVRGTFENPDKANITAVLSADTTHTGNPIWLRSFVLGNAKSSFNYLGLESEETEFYVYLKDRWGNRTDTKTFTLTPLFEEELDKDFWKKYDLLPSDVFDHLEYYRFEMIWDKKNIPDNNFWVSQIFTKPVTSTIDLGQRVSLSRLVLYHAAGYAYVGVPQKFELWVSDVDKPEDDLLGGDWQLIAELEHPVPENRTAEDKERVVFEGEVFFIEETDEIPNPYVPFRYLRIRSLEFIDDGGALTWRYYLGEIDLFGQVVK